MKNFFRTPLILLYASLVVIVLLLVLFLTGPSEEGIPSEEATLTVQAPAEAVALSPRVAEGLALFKSSGCVACHDLCVKKVGPPLQDISSKRKKDWIHGFVRNSAKMIEDKDPLAVSVFTENNRVPMPAHEFLSGEEIDKIIVYLDSAACGS